MFGRDARELLLKQERTPEGGNEPVQLDKVIGRIGCCVAVAVHRCAEPDLPLWVLEDRPGSMSHAMDQKKIPIEFAPLHIPLVEELRVRRPSSRPGGEDVHMRIDGSVVIGVRGFPGGKRPDDFQDRWRVPRYRLELYHCQATME